MTKDEMLAEYEVLGFAYCMCIVRRKSDGVKGTLDFTDNAPHGERQYHGFQPVSP
jgi:hypothetical protein